MVTFKSNYGANETLYTRTVTAPVTAIDTADFPVTPLRDGYTFTGWNTSPNGLGSGFTASTAVSADITVYAQWQENSLPPLVQYTITFDSHDGSVVGAVTADTGTSIVQPAAPTRAGYTFTGWFNAASGGTQYAWPHTLTGDVTMHAQWQENSLPPPVQYTITFNSHDGSAVAAITADTGTSVAQPAAPTRAGYTFTGWFSAVSGGTQYAWPHTLTGDVTMHAQWQENSLPPPVQYTITFDSHDGSAVTAITADTGTSVAQPAAPIKAGYTFTGWFSAASGGTPYTWPHTLTGDVTMHAQWTLISYTIAYTLNGGTNNAVNPVSYTIESPAITLAAPSRAGYTFGGWYSDAGFTAAATEIPTGSSGNKIFYAQWTLISYTIAYTLNGGTNNAVNPASYTLEPPAITLAAPNRAGYTFGGWYSDAGFTATATGIPTGSSGNKIFYAQWTIISYTIAYTLNGGTNNAVNPASYTVEGPTITLAAPNRAGYTFGGWYSDAGFTATATGIPTGSSGDKTFYAQWTINSSDQSISLTIDDFTGLTDPAGSALDDPSFTLAKPGETKTITVIGGGTDVTWYIGLVNIGTGNSVTLSAATLTVGTHTLRVTAKYGGVRYSKELAFTVQQ
jgi:uncharacterized repeat protein (TIGR02543 family)